MTTAGLNTPRELVPLSPERLEQLRALKRRRGTNTAASMLRSTPTTILQALDANVGVAPLTRDRLEKELDKLHAEGLIT